jgi:hypothetical protein
MSHVDKRTGEVVSRPYPKVGGRLRLAHEENENLNISTKIIRYEENVAVVRAQATTNKGTFNGLGMASLERDQHLQRPWYGLSRKRPADCPGNSRAS